MSLDELFDSEPSPPRERTPRPLLGWLVRAGLGSIVLGGAAVAVLLMFDLRIWYPAAAIAILATLVVFRAVSILAPARVAWPGNGHAEPVEPARHDGREPVVRQWAARVRGRRYGRGGLRKPLAALVDERLRQRHGCTLASAPERARRLLGEPLWTYLTGSGSQDPRPAELAAMLTTVEEL